MKKQIACAVTMCLVLSQLPAQLFADAEDAESLLFQDVPVVIAATKTRQSISVAPAAATVYTGEQLKRLGAVTLADALKLVPGVYVSVSERHLMRLHIRGIGNTVSSYNDKVLLLIDGTPLREPVYGHAFVDEFLPVENIKRVEVIKGPGSALYGTNAFAGVINVVTKEADDVDGIEAAAGAGTAQTKLGHILTGHTLKDVKVSLFAKTFQSRGDGSQFASQSQRNALQEDPTKAESYSMRTSYKGLSLDAKHFRFTHEFPPNWDIPETAWDRFQFNYNRTLVDLKYEKPVTDWLEGMAKVWWWDVHDSIYNQRRSGFNITGETYTNRDAYQYGAQTEAKAKLPGGHILVGGFQLDIEKITRVLDFEITRATNRPVEPTRFAIVPVGHKNYGFYAQDIWEPNDWVDITAGVRHDVNADYGDFTSPRGGIVFHTSGASNLKLLYGEAFRGPSNREKYVIASGLQEGNINLTPEKIRTGEVEFNYTFMKGLRAQVNYYQNRVRDTITNTTVGGRTVWINDVGLSVIEGIESQLEYTVGKTRTFANYSWSDGRDKNGDVLYNVPSHLANAGFDYTPVDELSVSPTVSYVGDRYRSAEDSNSSGRDDRYPRGLRRPDIAQYVVVNLPITYKYKGFEFMVAVYNLLDQQYFDPNETVQSRDIERPGRNFLAKAGYKF